MIADSPVRVEHGIRIKGAGYFDTVAAMGVPDNQANPFRENTDPYLDQFCNVDHVFQAVSLDDNRALDFTPLLATDPRRIEPCTPSESHPDIREVWFSGAHADVGGTYSDERGLDGHLPGNSLNWMIAQIHSLFKVDEVRLLPVGAGQYANPLDVIHHARNGLAIWRARPLAFRRPLEWIGDSTLRIHFTVAQRFEQLVSIESNFSSRCAEHARRPTLRCVNDLKTNGFLGELLAHHCVREVETRIDSNTKVVGYGFLGQPEAVPHAAEMRFVQSPGTDVECSRIVIAFDTEAQRNAHLSDTWARPAPRED